MSKPISGFRSARSPGQITSLLLRAIALILASGSTDLQAQQSPAGALLTLRAQAASIAGEAWSSLADSSLRPGDIWVVVEGGTAKRVVENAFLEFLSQRGYRPLLGTRQDQGGERVQVTVLEQTVLYKLLQNGNSEREIRTAMEIRLIAGREETVRRAGPFRRAIVDTVAIRDDEGLAGLRNAEEPSFVDRIVGPVLLIGGAFLVIYLFFTVRN